MRFVNVLLVDDDNTDLEFTKRAFLSTGRTMSIQALNDGNQAISYLMGEGEYSNREKFPYPKILVSDLKMPIADGFDILNHLQKNQPWAIIPTIILSSSEDNEDIRTAYMLGASAYHVKPFQFSELCTIVNTLMNYWDKVKSPLIDSNGKQIINNIDGKLGKRFKTSSQLEQLRSY